MKKLSISIISIICAIALMICDCVQIDAFAVEKKEYDVYCVSIRANFRAKATKNSRWIMTIPTGVFVVIEGELQNSYYKAQYGEYEGYIYKGCIKKTDECTYYNYQLQFPDLFGAVLPENASDVMVDKFNTYSNTNTEEVNGKVKYTGNVKDGSKDKQVTQGAKDPLKDKEQAEQGVKDPLKNKEQAEQGVKNPVSKDANEKPSPKRLHTCTAGLDRKQAENEADVNAEVSQNDTIVLGDDKDDNNKDENKDDNNTEIISQKIEVSGNDSTPDSEAKEGEAEQGDKSNSTINVGVSPSLAVPMSNGTENAKKIQEKIAIQNAVDSKVLAQSNLRDAPSIEGKQILIIPMGDTVKVLDSGDNGYAHVLYKEQEGYIFTRCIDYKDDSENSNGLINTVVVDELEKKSGKRAGITYTPSAYSIQRHAVANNASVMLSDKVYNKEVAKEETEMKVDTSVVQAKSSTESLMNVEQNVIGRTANLRSVASPDSNIITTIAVGTNITVLGSNAGGYTMVQYEGKIGYVAEECIADSIDITQFGTEPLLFSVTAYCSCKKCCGNYSPEVRGGEAHTATGTVPEQGRTIAVDPSVIPYGTKVYIDGYGTFIAEDCGGAIKGNHIDMYFATHADAIAFGSRRLYCTVVNE